MSFFSYSQTETEPNNTISAADTVAENVVMSGDVSNADLNDYFFTVLPDDGTLKLKFDYSGTDPANQTDFYVDVRNKNNGVIGSFSMFNLVDGVPLTDSIMVYCRAADSVYFRFNIGAASGSANYAMTYSVAVPGPNDAEPNDALPQANEVFESVSYPGRLGYTSISQDLTDNYFTVLPDDGTLTLRFNFSAYTQTATTDMRVRVLNKNGGQIGFFQENNLLPDSTYTDSIVVTCRAADTVYFEFFNFSSSGCYAYDFEYSQTVHGPNDAEPNDNLASAFEVLENTNYTGRLGSTSIAQDIEDNYFTILPDDGTLILRFNYTAHADGNTTDMRVRVLNKNGGQIGTFSRNNLALDTTYSDSIIVHCRAGDTVYFEFYNFISSGCYVYDFEYHQIIHGPNDPEPNDDLTTASQVFENINYPGRLGNVSIAQDIVDNYYTILPDDGTLILRFNYTAHSAGNTTDMRVRVLNKDGGQIGIFSRNNLALDTTYSDSIVVHCRADDTVYFEFYNFLTSGCYVYDFEYDQIIHGPNDPEPNDDLASASEVLENTNYAGRLGNVSISQDIVDNYFTVLPDNGTLVLKFNYTAHSSDNTTDMRVRVFNKNGAQIGIFSRNNLVLDTTYSDSLLVYCRAADTVYFEFYNFSGSGCYVYDFEYEINRPTFANDQESNDDFASAQFQSVGIAATGHAGYTSVATDVNDYHMYILPEDGHLKIDLDYRANLNNGSSDLFLYAYSSDQVQRFFNSFINVKDDTTLSTIIDLYCFAKDTMYFRVHALSGCFDYQINTTFTPSSQGTDVEPNNSFAQATPISLLDTTYGATGHIGNGVDGIDYFSFYNSGYRKIDLIYELKRTGNPVNQNGVFQVKFYDSNQNQIDSDQYLNSIANDSVVTDTFSLSCPPLDTFYVSFSSSLTCIGYNIRFDVENGIYYADADSDNFGSNDSSIYSCVGPPAGFVADNSDCDDNNPNINPNAIEICDGVDNNCDGNIDEGIYTTSNTNAAICQGDSILIGGMYRFSAGVYTDTAIVLNGCDSISNVTVSVNPTHVTGSTTTTGDPGLAGIFSSTFTNQFGCDSTHIDTVVYVAPPCPTTDSTTVTMMTCDSTMAGSSSVTLQGSDGCDSVVTTVKIYDPGSLTALAPMSVCDGDSLLIFGKYQSAAGTYYDTVQNVNGCDSVLSKQLNIKPTYSTHIFPPVFVCNNNVAIVFGIPRGASGTYYDTLTASNGCDSILSRDLIRNGINDTLTTPLIICQGDSVNINGTFYSQSGTYVEECQFIPHSPCQNCLYRNLIVLPNSVVNVAKMICSGDSVLAGGAYQTGGGTYYDTLMASNGCDSIVITSITVKPNSTGSATVMICDGDSVLLGGAYQTNAGVYTDTYPAANGCDSIVSTTLIVKPNVAVSATAMICDGDSILLGGAYQTTAGIYKDTYPASNGCDSVVTTTLSIKPNISVTVKDSICQGDSLFAGGAYQTTAGTYTDVYAAGNGCDSTVITMLSIRTDTACGGTPIAQGCLSIVSDNGWSQSTVITPSNFSGTWNGATGLPGAGTYTNPVTVGQPYGFASINTIENSEVLSTGSDITYFRKEFSLTSASNLDVRILTTVDDQADIYLNGQRVALITSFGRANFKFPAHDVKFYSNGTVSNGHLAGDAFDVVTATNLNSILTTGTNELVVAVRNLGKASDKGGLSFRMDINCNDGDITKKAASADMDNRLVLFPNPVQDLLTISSDLAITSIKVHDLNGKLISSNTYNAEKDVLVNMSELPQGVYMVTVNELGGEINVMKVVKN